VAWTYCENGRWKEGKKQTTRREEIERRRLRWTDDVEVDLRRNMFGKNRE
jgi:hypothetical protein